MRRCLTRLEFLLAAYAASTRSTSETIIYNLLLSAVADKSTLHQILVYYRYTGSNKTRDRI